MHCSKVATIQIARFRKYFWGFYCLFTSRFNSEIKLNDVNYEFKSGNQQIQINYFTLDVANVANSQYRESDNDGEHKERKIHREWLIFFNKFLRMTFHRLIRMKSCILRTCMCKRDESAATWTTNAYIQTQLNFFLHWTELKVVGFEW